MPVVQCGVTLRVPAGGEGHAAEGCPPGSTQLDRVIAEVRTRCGRGTAGGSVLNLPLGCYPADGQPPPLAMAVDVLSPDLPRGSLSAPGVDVASTYGDAAWKAAGHGIRPYNFSSDRPG
jgi:hypothetical protein